MDDETRGHMLETIRTHRGAAPGGEKDSFVDAAADIQLRIEDAACIAYIMAPDFVLFEDHVFIKDFLDRTDPRAVREFLDDYDAEDAETAINCLELNQFLPQEAGEGYSVDFFEALGERIARSWRLHAETAFPGRAFEAFFQFEEEDEDGASDPIVCLYQVRG